MIWSAPAMAAPIFSDNFTAGASSAWGNQRGQWRANDGVYDATNPTNTPVTYSSVTTLELTDFAAEVDVNALDDGGLWLRSAYNGGNISGVLLVTGGLTGSFNGFYWHTVVNGSFSGILNQVAVSGLQGANVHLRVEAIGNSYSVYMNGGTSPVASLTTSLFASGQFGLYDFSPTSKVSSPRGQTFDNVVIYSLVDIPTPGALMLLVLGLFALAGTRQFSAA